MSTRNSVKQMEQEIAAIYVRLENLQVEDAKVMCLTLASEKQIEVARKEYAELVAGESAYEQSAEYKQWAISKGILA